MEKKKSVKKRSGKKSLKRTKKTDIASDAFAEKEKERLQTEDALLESMKRFRDLFEQSPIGVGIHNTDGELLIVNKSYLKIFGLNSFGEITLQNLFTDLKIPVKETKKVRSGKIIQFEAQYDFDKSVFPTLREGTGHVLFTVSPIFREKDVTGYMVQVQDITERKKIAESQRLAHLGRLLSDMSHEVNNPLMIISGRAELALLEGVKDEKIRDILTIILDQCFLAKDIIQGLLRYSRLGTAEKTPVDIQKTIELITNILSHHFKMSDIVLEKDVKPGLSMIMGNEKQLQQVFMNITRNSAEAMPDGGVITIRAERDGDYLKITVEDTGEGMSRKVMEKIFEPFFTTKQKGTGLGMAVCHTIIQEHGGHLRYDSCVGKGTTATILLPILASPGD